MNCLLKSAIDARRKNDSLLIDIEVAHPYPYVSKYLADELAHGYVRYTQELQAKQRARERADLEKTALDLSQDLKATAQDLQAFRQSSGLSITEGGDSIQSSQLQAVTAALSKAKIEFKFVQPGYAWIKAFAFQLGGQALVVAS